MKGHYTSVVNGVINELDQLFSKYLYPNLNYDENEFSFFKGWLYCYFFLHRVKCILRYYIPYCPVSL